MNTDAAVNFFLWNKGRHWAEIGAQLSIVAKHNQVALQLVSFYQK